MNNPTKHTCGGPVFGKRTAGCPRCDDLAAGAAPVKWSIRNNDPQRLAEKYPHSCIASHCGPVCTFGEW